MGASYSSQIGDVEIFLKIQERNKKDTWEEAIVA